MMLGTWFRRLLCCYVKSDDSNDLKAPQEGEKALTSSRAGKVPDERKTAERETGGVEQSSPLSYHPPSASEVDPKGAAASRKHKYVDGKTPTKSSQAVVFDPPVASEEVQRVPTSVQGAADSAPFDSKGPSLRVKAWFSSKNGKEGVAMALEAARLALESASGVLGNLSVPGAEFSIGVVLSIISNAQTSIENSKVLDDLRERLNSLSFVVLIPLSQAKESEKVREQVQCFIREIDKQSENLAVWNSSSRVMRFLRAKLEEKELLDFSRGIENAVKNFQLMLLIDTAVIQEKQDKLLNGIKSGIDTIERKMDLQAMDTLLEKLLRTGTLEAAARHQGKIVYCHDETCQRILSEAKGWAINVEPEAEQRQIFWLSGRAGTGKSTIAKTIAKWAAEEGILGSKYFFSRDEELLNNSSLAIPAIAYDIAQFDPSVKEVIAKAVEKDKRLVHEPIETTFQAFIKGPLATRTSAAPRKLMLLVIDSLDECSDPKAMEVIIRLLLDLVADSNPHIRIFLTSRPESYIEHTFGEDNKRKYIRYNLEDYADSRDIEAYLYGGLSNTYGEVKWRELEVFRKLVIYSGNLFIFASTALRYIRAGSDFGNPVKRAAELLGPSSGATSGEAPYEQLDQLYLHILNQAIGSKTKASSDEMVRFRNILGTIVELSDSLPLDALVALLDMNESTASLRRKLEGLSSLIVVPPLVKSNIPVRLFHPSLLDFLKDRERCTDRFFIDSSLLETQLSQRSLQLAINGLSGNVKAEVLPAMRYGCMYWADHLRNAKLGDAQVMERLDCFIRNHLLKWFRVTRILLSSASSLFPSMEYARVWLEASKCDSELTQVLNDMIQSSATLDSRLLESYEATYDNVRYVKSTEGCFPGTRAASLEEIQEWVMASDAKAPNFYWLSGPAKTGKSTIALSIADWAEEKGFLAGSFFFIEPEDPWIVFCTIAHDLASFDRSMRKLIIQALGDESLNLRNLDTRLQFQYLISNPLLSLKVDGSMVPPKPILIIIDNLDYYDDPGRLISLFLSNLCGVDSPHIRVLFTSNPNLRLRGIFEQHQAHYKAADLNEIPYPDVQTDIKHYLVNELSRVHEKLGLPFAGAWPDTCDVDSLVYKSGGLFHYARLAVQFIADDSVCKPTHQLRIWLDDHGDEHDLDFKNLFRNWLQDMRCDNDEEIKQLCLVIAVVVLLEDPLSLESLADLIQMDAILLRTTLRRLYPFIISPDSPEAPRSLHPSLRDFLTNKDNLEGMAQLSFFVDVPNQEAYLCRCCLERMAKNLTNDMATSTIGIEDGGGGRSKAERPEEKVGMEIDSVLRYACLYWVEHLSKAEHENSSLRNAIDIFVRNHLLKWFEAMRILGLAPALLSFMQKAYEWLEVAYCSSIIELPPDATPLRPTEEHAEADNENFTLMLMKEALQFVEDNHFPSEASMSEVYQSVLALPEDSLLRRTYDVTVSGTTDETVEPNPVVRSPKLLWLKTKKVITSRSRVVARFVEGVK
ncbi:hypothetical protein SCHPADRAFT_999452 [Schizopora paradoxa]|uniref:NACHT domain-containing protein n=1 Tax=Schizopora paradoxa TaxID=27342 RepID=A0A0H2RFK0_9AGAM|nr:hypothetical protein SCHPADRAFT_999452 [Schizopora paradoxa]